MFRSQWHNVFLRILLKKICILVKIHLTANVSYHDIVIFWKLNISAERKKNTLKGFENNTKHRYKRNCLLIEAATGVALYKKLFLKTSQYSRNIPKFLRAPILKNTANGCFGTLEYWEKNFFLLTEKMANRKVGNIGRVGNLGKITSSFLISQFSILP